jgi:hypothetical protein
LSRQFGVLTRTLGWFVAARAVGTRHWASCLTGR